LTQTLLLLYFPNWENEGASMPTDTLSLTFGALAHPVRRQILARLSRGEASVLELAKPFKMGLPSVSKHLKVLEECGLISRGRDAQWRPARLEAKPLIEANQWMEKCRKEWEDRFGRLEAYLQKLQNEEGGRR
jgi:DNA-binding transcriptional ArsR family regulator